MEIICSIIYDRRALPALARTLRKTVRRMRSRLLCVWCWVLLVLSLLSAWISWGRWGTVAFDGTVATLMSAVLLEKDAINAFFAKWNALPRVEMYVVHLLEEHYRTRIAGVTTQWKYSKLLRLTKNDRYLVLILGRDHGQLCDREGVVDATLEELHAFLEKKTGLMVERLRQRGPPLRYRGNLFALGIKGIRGIQK